LKKSIFLKKHDFAEKKISKKHDFEEKKFSKQVLKIIYTEKITF